MLQAVRQSVPPLWLLDKVLSTPAAYATVRGLSPGEIEVPAPDGVETVIRKHIVNLRCFLMRTRTPQYARWASQAKVQSAHVVEATETVLRRLTAMASSTVVLRDTDVVMEGQ